MSRLWIMISDVKGFVQRFGRIKKRAYTESVGVGPKLEQIVLLTFCRRYLRADIPGLIQPDVVEEHLALAAGHGAAFCAYA